MRKKLLLSTAALLAGMTLASAQSMPGGGHATGNSAAQDHRESTQGRSGQAQQAAPRQQSRPQQGQAQQAQPQQRQPQQGQAHPAQPQQGATSGQAQTSGAAQTNAGGSVTLTAEQRTRIQQTVLARSDVPRVN